MIVTIMEVSFSHKSTGQQYPGCNENEQIHAVPPYFEYIDTHNVSKRLCFTRTNITFVTYTNEAYGKFVWNGDLNVVPHIRIEVKKTPYCCGGIFYAKYGAGQPLRNTLVTSPDYPLNYEAGMECPYIFRCIPEHNEENCALRLDFIDFQLKPQSPYSGHSPHMVTACDGEDRIQVSPSNSISDGTTYCYANPPKSSICAYNQILVHFSANEVGEDRGFVISLKALETKDCTFSDEDKHPKNVCGLFVPNEIIAHHQTLQDKNQREKYIIRRKRKVKKTLQIKEGRNRGEKQQNKALGNNSARVQQNTRKSGVRRRKSKPGKRAKDNAQDGKEKINKTKKKKRVNKGNRRARKKRKIHKDSMKKTLKKDKLQNQSKRKWKKKKGKDKEVVATTENGEAHERGGSSNKFPNLVTIVQLDLKKSTKRKPKDKKKRRPKVARLCGGYIINENFIITITSCCTYCLDIWNKEFRKNQQTTHSHIYSSKDKENGKGKNKGKHKKHRIVNNKRIDDSRGDENFTSRTTRRNEVRIKRNTASEDRKMVWGKDKITHSNPLKKVRTKSKNTKEKDKKVRRKKGKSRKPKLSDIKVGTGIHTRKGKGGKRYKFEQVESIWIPEECAQKMRKKTRNGKKLFPVECPVLLRLQNSLHMPHSSAFPVCLPIFQTYDPFFLAGSSIGYGYTHTIHNHAVGEIIKGIVRLPTSLCEERLKGQVLDETMMCTSAEADRSMCLGDEGTPFLVYTEPEYGFSGYLSAYAALAVPGCPKSSIIKKKPKPKRSVDEDQLEGNEESIRKKHKVIKSTKQKLSSKQKLKLSRGNDTNQSNKTIKKDDNKNPGKSKDKEDKNKQPGKSKDKEDKNKQPGKSKDKEDKKKKQKGKKKKSNKYNKKKTTNVGIDVWVKVTAYVNWIIKVVFHGNDDLVYQRLVDHFHLN
ncbi:triadin-like isoform X2 [Eriocheir sinensis]|nr:triadin-like isoform X2 [Eriocheir sinensis]